ncbi:DNA ligase D [Bordetella genomosp. 13]|uniref:DNA ligase D n=1 Tax=Bordetella genomosp. 13 TaxID=463040 RepID=UPI0011A52824|nr:DNA ligase D [Bordetella genomosp. 13]
MPASLKTYREKRDFKITAEPKGGGRANARQPAFVIQKHWATRLHYDLRLELDGAMKSWAVPKGPCYDPSVKRMAVQVEDHPIAYNQFEGEIPKGQYGAGKVIIWDEGTWEPLVDPRKGYREGHLKFTMHGTKMQGTWALVRLRGRDEKKPTWLLIKDRDDYARTEVEFSVVDQMPDSVVPLRGKKANGTGGKASSTAASRPSSKTSSTATSKASEEDGSGDAANSHAKPARKSPAKRTAKAPARASAKSATQAVLAAAAAVEDETDAARPARGSKRASATDDDADLPGVAAALPKTLSPQLATLVDRAPATPDDWLYEIKFDGYRILARIEDGQARLYTRNGHDWTAKLPQIAQALGQAKADGWVDGEIVVMAEHGVPSFQALQNAFDTERPAQIQYFAFDLPYVAGRDLRGEPLRLRRALLEQMIAPIRGKSVQFSAALDAAPQELVASACHMGLEGIIAKRRDSTYVSRRSDNWLKLKCGQRQEFVVVGYTAPKGRRVGFGSLALAVHDADGRLRYAGNVGSGFDDELLARMKTQLEDLRTDECPLVDRKGVEGRPQWVRPELVAEVSFSEWTQSGHARHPVFRGLRTDKPAKKITRERPQDPDDANGDASPGDASRRGAAARLAGKAATGRPGGKTGARTAASDADVPVSETRSLKSRSGAGRLSHPERVIDPSTGLTKLDLARYYGLVAPLMLPHLKARPVAFMRAPQGVDHPLFFQKHLDSAIEDVKSLPKKLSPDHPPMMEVATDMGILSAAQMNVVEFHTWNAVKTAIAKPDRMLFDLDPGEGVQWKTVVEGAQLVQALLRELDLACWLKTSGGKGLHVVVPLRRQYSWDTVRQFSEAIVRHLASALPQRFVAKSGPKNRVGKIFVDYLRNGFGATTVAAWSARARPGMGISVPITWSELPSLSSAAHWTIADIHHRLDVGNAPWDDYAGQSLGEAMRALDFK